MMRNPKKSVLNIILLITLAFLVTTSFQVNEIAKNSGFIQTSHFIRSGILGFFVINVLLSLFVISLFFPFSVKLFAIFQKAFIVLRRVKYLHPVWVLISLSVLFALTIAKIDVGFSTQRLLPLMIWLCFLTLLFNFFIFAPGLFSKSVRFFDGNKKLNILLLCLVILGFVLWLVTPTGRYFQSVVSRIWLLAIFTMMGSEIIRLAYPNVDSRQVFEISFIVCIVILIVCAYCYSSITSYPFALTWSEGKWFVDAAIIFSPKVFGAPTLLPFEEPTRAIIQSLPYLFTNSPSILLLRIWQTVLFLGIPLGCGFACIHQFKVLKGFQKILVIGWLFSFFFIGPIKFYLLLPLMIFFLGFNSHKFIQSLIVIIVSAICIPPIRFNWYPLLGALALLVYVIENQFGKNPIKYFWKPAVWIIASIGISALSYLFFVKVFGNSAMVIEFLSKTTFIWGRLFPSATNPLGLLPSIIICSLPLLVIILLFTRKNQGKIHWIRITTIGTLLFLFFIGGILVSCKIGGGNNLHNFDGYLILLMVCDVYFVFNVVTGEKKLEGIGTDALNRIILIGIILQGGWIIYYLPGLSDLKTLASADVEINHIQELVNNVKKNDPRPVLFLYQTQLLATKTIQGVLPVANLDNVALLDFALSNSPSLLSDYYEGISKQTWSMILMPPVFSENIKNADFEFGEENNAWITYIARPLLCSYHSVEQSLDFDYEIFLPTENAQSCIQGE